MSEPCAANKNKMTEADIYLDKFSETGLPVFEKAAELAKTSGQFHIGEGHIIVALSIITPQWFAAAVERRGAMPEQILAAAERKIVEIPPYTKGGLKIHPSAAAFFKDAMRSAEAGERSQIDALDLIDALELRVENY